MIIRRPQAGDQTELHSFFKRVLTHTFEEEGIMHLHDDLLQEIELKKKMLAADLRSSGADRYFLLAVHPSDGKIVGTIEYGQPNDLIVALDDQIAGLFEAGTIFVDPEFQGQGLGTLLLNALILHFTGKGVTEFCLDSGYKRAQKVWKAKLGEPLVISWNHWGKDSHHMIWRVSVDSFAIKFRFPDI
ncbi:GNAT family N-acetyltransferase [Peribacillus sp. SCS-37]|uniref:GNAT family N-acetyltransferase n=1 Tax=Paraperibacillus esterisolvens TaxID=3115296 RepID=UPI0039059A2D